MPRPVAAPLHFEAYSSENAPIFEATLKNTYTESLDAPELNGVRSIPQILESHRQEGRDRPDLWWLVRHKDQPVGVVLLTQFVDGLHWNLSYMGLIPEVRGQGWGYALGFRAIATAHAEGALELWNSVDERNLPARKLYAKLGFEEHERQQVLLKSFR